MLSDLDDEELEDIESHLYSQIHYGTTTGVETDNSSLTPTNPTNYHGLRYYEQHILRLRHSNIPVTTTTRETTNVPSPTCLPQESAVNSNLQCLNETLLLSVPQETNTPDLNTPMNIPNPQQHKNKNQQKIPAFLSTHNKLLIETEKLEKTQNRKNLAKKVLRAKAERIVKAANEDAELFRNLSKEERKSVFKYQKRQRYLERKRLRKLEKMNILVDEYNKGLDTFSASFNECNKGIPECNKNLNEQNNDLNQYNQGVNDFRIGNFSPQLMNPQSSLPQLNQPILPKEDVEIITQQNDEVVSLSGSDGSSCIAVDITQDLLIISDDDNDLSEPPKISSSIPKVEDSSDVDIEQKNKITPAIDDEDDVIYVEQQPAIVIDLDPEIVTKESQAPTDSELMKPPDFETLSVCSVSSNNLNPDLKASNLKSTPVKAKIAAKEREELLSTPESNDFLDTTLDVDQTHFNFSLHEADFNSPKEAKSKTLADMYGSESSCSASDISAPVKTPIFNEIDFDSSSKGLFSENNLKSFSDFITPKRASTSIQITPLLTPSREIFEQVQTKAVGSRSQSDSDSSSESEYEDSKAAQIAKKLPDLSHFETTKTPKADKNFKNVGESSKKKKKKTMDLTEELVSSPKEKKRKKGKVIDFGGNSSDEKDEAKRKKKKVKKGSSSLEGSDNEFTPKKMPRKDDEAEPSEKKLKRKKNKEEEVTQSATKKFKRKKRIYDEWIENDNDEQINSSYLEVDEDVLNTSGESVHEQDKSPDKLKKINIMGEQVLSSPYDFNKNKSKKGKKTHDKAEEHDGDDSNEFSKSKKLKKKQKSSELQEDNDEVADEESEVVSARVKKGKKSRKCSELSSGHSDRNDEDLNEITEDVEDEIIGRKIKKSKIPSELQEERKDDSSNVEGVMELDEVSNKQMKRTRKCSDNKSNETLTVSNEIIEQTEKRRKSCENIGNTKEVTDKSGENDGNKEVALDTEVDAINQQKSTDIIQESKEQTTIAEFTISDKLPTCEQTSSTPLLDTFTVTVQTQNSNNKLEQKYSDISEPEDNATNSNKIEQDEQKPDILVIDYSDSDVEFIDNEIDVIELGDSDSVPCEDPSVMETCNLSPSSASSSSYNKDSPIGLETAAKDMELVNLTPSMVNADANRRKRFSDYFTRDMKEFYTHTYDDEVLSLEDIQKNMSDSPSKWKILERDRVHIRYGKERGPRCRRCREVGHIAINCRNKPGIPKCWLCGNRGHYEPRCRNKICTQCGRKCFETTVFCSKCAYLRNRTCKLCKMIGHERDNCPDIWRRYHLTITEGPIVKSAETPLKAYEHQWCSGCAQNGHLEHECQYIGREYPPAVPYIVNYEELYGFPQVINEDVNHLADMQSIRVSFDNDQYRNQSLVVHNPKVTVDTNSSTRMVEEQVEQVDNDTLITECILFTSVQSDILKTRSGQMFLCGLATRFHLPLRLSKHSTMTLNCIYITATKSLGLKVKEMIMEFLHGKSTIENKKLYFKLKHHLELLASIPLEQPSYLLKLISKTRNVKLDKYVRLNTILFGKYGLEDGKNQTKLLQDIFMKFDTSKRMTSSATKIINNALSYVFLNVRTMNKYRKLVKISKTLDLETDDIAKNYTFLNSVYSTPEYMSLETEPKSHTEVLCVKPYSTSKFTRDTICKKFLLALQRDMQVEVSKQNIVLHGPKDKVREGAWKLKMFKNNLHLVEEFPHETSAIYEKLVKSIANVNVWWYIENIRNLYDDICRLESQNDKDFSPADCRLLGRLYTKVNAILFGKYCVSKSCRGMQEIINWTHKLTQKELNKKGIRPIIIEAYFKIFDFNKKDFDYKVIDGLVIEPSKSNTNPQNVRMQKDYINNNLMKYMVIAAEHEDDIKIQEIELLMSTMKKDVNLDGIVRYVQDLEKSYK